MAGKLLTMDAKQGDLLEPGKQIALIDTTELYLKKLQTQAQLTASDTKKQNVSAQINVYKEQKKNVLTTQQRIAKMFADKAATQLQVDDINGQMNVLDKQISATNTQFSDDWQRNGCDKKATRPDQRATGQVPHRQPD